MPSVETGAAAHIRNPLATSDLGNCELPRVASEARGQDAQAEPRLGIATPVAVAHGRYSITRSADCDTLSVTKMCMGYLFEAVDYDPSNTEHAIGGQIPVRRSR